MPLISSLRPLPATALCSRPFSRRLKQLFFLSRAALLALGLVQVFCVAQATEPDVPTELIDFGPVSRAALFAGGGQQAWDRDLRERGWIMREGGLWHLWYTGSNAATDPVRRVGYASSCDGLNWSRSLLNPLVGDRWVEDVCVVKQGMGRSGQYWMFAEGDRDVAHLLLSRDRLHWQQQGPLDIRLVSGAPIDDGPRGTPAVWLEKKTWYLFYERMDLGVWLATSKDLKVFTNTSDEPVLACGPEGYDRYAIAIDQIVSHKGRYYAYYHASALKSRSEWTTCIATSDDLRHWKKSLANPIVPVDPAHPKQSSATLIFDGSRHRLYTTHPDVRVRYSISTVPHSALLGSPDDF